MVKTLSAWQSLPLCKKVEIFAFRVVLNSTTSWSICRMAMVLMGKLIAAFLKLCTVWWKKRAGVCIHVCACKGLPWHGAKALKWWTEAFLYLQRAFATMLTSTDLLIPEALSSNTSPQHPKSCPSQSRFQPLLVCSLQYPPPPPSSSPCAIEGKS